MKHIILWLGLPVMLVAGWFVIRPGILVQQPIGALPDGVTMIYYGRSSALPFITSADGLCLQMQGSVSLFCRGSALAGLSGLKDRIIVHLPYSETAYLWTTGGQTFER